MKYFIAYSHNYGFDNYILELGEDDLSCMESIRDIESTLKRYLKDDGYFVEGLHIINFVKI